MLAAWLAKNFFTRVCNIISRRVRLQRKPRAVIRGRGSYLSYTHKTWSIRATKHFHILGHGQPTPTNSRRTGTYTNNSNSNVARAAEHAPRWSVWAASDCQRAQQLATKCVLEPAWSCQTPRRGPIGGLLEIAGRLDGRAEDKKVLLDDQAITKPASRKIFILLLY